MIFNKPEKRNAVSLDVWKAMPGISRHFETGPAVRAIGPRGAGDKALFGIPAARLGWDMARRV